MDMEGGKEGLASKDPEARANGTQGLERGQSQMATLPSQEVAVSSCPAGPWAGITEVGSAVVACVTHTWEQVLARAGGTKRQSQGAAVDVGPWKLGQPPRCLSQSRWSLGSPGWEMPLPLTDRLVPGDGRPSVVADGLAAHRSFQLWGWASADGA